MAASHAFSTTVLMSCWSSTSSIASIPKALLPTTRSARFAAPIKRRSDHARWSPRFAWHAATGATDNAIGCAIMMEAARILKTLGVKPRRTIRVALWSGEEQGLLGSIAYVKNILAHSKIQNRVTRNLVVTSTSTRARGECAWRLGVWTTRGGKHHARDSQPFKNDGVVGAVATRSRRLGGSTIRRSIRPACRASAWARIN